MEVTFDAVTVAEADPYVSTQPFNRSVYESTKPLRIGYYDYDGFCEALPTSKRAVAQAKVMLEEQGHTLGWYAML